MNKGVNLTAANSLAGEEVDVLDISKVKDINKLQIKPNYVIIEVTGEEDNRILINDPSLRRNNVTWKIIRVGEAVKGIEVGDVVVDMSFRGANFLTKDNVKYIYCEHYNILLSTPEDNYGE